MKLRMIDRATRETDEVDDDFKSAIDMFFCLCHYFYRSKRYIFRRSRYRKRSDEAFTDDLECSDNEESGKQSFLSDDEFLQKYRMSRSSFHTLVELIEDHPVISTKIPEQLEIQYEQIKFSQKASFFCTRRYCIMKGNPPTFLYHCSSIPL